ncbi:hypothetical protein BWK59_01260 [Flavobacterium davisii]|uniref:Glycosyltransferase 2-like domain-containing protein n=1 Tax=Flavobacterium davisii TaxID=2906077 RepID=A0A2D0AIX4_9FLAO|nr:glycosyltransferase family A protein [Flavobacterium davisii]OWP85199.1 hypothetical protein BWK59_01260 [Flavobacterium davisii]
MNSIGKNNIVSVIMPVYNAEDSVLESIKSVLLQTYVNWELIIVDDGSLDNSYNKIKKFINEIDLEYRKKIHLFNQINSGPSVARNFGVYKSIGEFIAFIDSDDIWIPNKLYMQVDIANNNPDIGLIGGGFEKKNFDSSHSIVSINFRKLLFKNYFPTPTVLIRKEKFIFNFDPKKKYSEDYLTWMLITSQYNAFYINEILAYNYISKREFGEKGLSSNLIKMERSELDNYFYLYKQKKIKFLTYILVCTYSLLKFVRRFLVSKIGRFI